MERRPGTTKVSPGASNGRRTANLPRRCSVVCVKCRRTLTYSVRSLAATRRRRARRWSATIVCFVAAIPVFGLAAIDPSNAIVLSVAMVGGVLALTMSWSLMLVAARDIGVVGPPSPTGVPWLFQSTEHGLQTYLEMVVRRGFVGGLCQ